MHFFPLLEWNQKNNGKRIELTIGKEIRTLVFDFFQIVSGDSEPELMLVANGGDVMVSNDLNAYALCGSLDPLTKLNLFFWTNKLDSQGSLAFEIWEIRIDDKRK